MTVANALVPAARPNYLVGLLRRYPLLSFFVIAYAFTAAFDLLVVARFPNAPSFPRDFGPSVAALVLTAATAGKAGLGRLLRRLVLWRVPIGIYLFVLLGIPATYILGILLVVPGALASFTPPSSAGWLLFPGVLGFLYVLVFVGPLFEEPGWRGFALPRMQTRWGPLAGAVILGVLWAAWHFTEYLAAPDFAATNGGLTPQGLGIYVLDVISFSVIITWVFNRTRGSVLLAILVHTAINWSQMITNEVFPAAGTNEVGPLVAFGLMALVLVVATRGRLGYAHVDSEPRDLIQVPDQLEKNADYPGIAHILLAESDT